MTYIIAEAGTAHLGNYDAALNLAEVAWSAGADAVKFQVFSVPSEMFCRLEGDEERDERWLASAMSFRDWQSLKEDCDMMGIELILSCFEEETVTWQKDLGLKYAKVASRAAFNYPYELIKGMVPLVSNGMHGVPRDLPRLVEFQCRSEYPSYELWNGDTPGFSDHSGCPITALNALSRGVPFLEVHFYDRRNIGPDAPVSLSLGQLALICESNQDVKNHGKLYIK